MLTSDIIYTLVKKGFAEQDLDLPEDVFAGKVIIDIMVQSNIDVDPRKQLCNVVTMIMSVRA